RRLAAVDDGQVERSLPSAKRGEDEQRHRIVGSARDQDPASAALRGEGAQRFIEIGRTSTRGLGDAERAKVLPDAVVPGAVTVRCLRTMLEGKLARRVRALDERVIEIRSLHSDARRMSLP